MGGIATALLCAALAQAGTFSFEGREAGARTTSSRAFISTGQDATVEQFEPARGEAELSVRDRIDVPAATYGDRGRFTATIRVGLEEYRVELVTVGAPPLHRDASGRLVESSTRQLFGFPTGGGVEMATVVFGRTGLGLLPMAPALAAISLFGTARVTRNGIVVDEQAPIEVFALATGVHADDDTHRRMPAARAEDTELIVYLPRVSSDLVPNRFLLFVFEDVAIEVAGRAVPQVASVPTEAGGPAGAVPRVAVLQGIPALSTPNFSGFSQDVVTRDNVPIGATPTPPSTTAPLNAAPAVPLPSTVAIPNTATPPPAGAVSATAPAAPLPQGIEPLNATPATPLGGTAPLIAPANASPAVPLVQTAQPLNAQPATTGPGTAASGALSPAVGGAGTAGTSPGAASGTAAGTSAPTR